MLKRSAMMSTAWVLLTEHCSTPAEKDAKPVQQTASIIKFIRSGEGTHS